ncbi:MAG: Fic/DOC family N-terminal domain-containing protein [Candidatus Limnocylindria bacterium]
MGRDYRIEQASYCAGVEPAACAPDQRRHVKRLAEGVHAYLPPPAPAEIVLPARLVNRLAETGRALGELNGTGRLLPNLRLLIAPYLRSEAVLSSRI